MTKLPLSLLAAASLAIGVISAHAELATFYWTGEEDDSFLKGANWDTYASVGSDAELSLVVGKAGVDAEVMAPANPISFDELDTNSADGVLSILSYDQLAGTMNIGKTASLAVQKFSLSGASVLNLYANGSLSSSAETVISNGATINFLGGSATLGNNPFSVYESNWNQDSGTVNILGGEFRVRNGLWTQSNGVVSATGYLRFAADNAHDTVNMKLSGNAKIETTSRLLLGTVDVIGSNTPNGSYVAELRDNASIESDNYLIVGHGVQRAEVKLYDDARLFKRASGAKLIIGDNGSPSAKVSLYNNSKILMVSGTELNVGWNGSIATLYMEGDSKIGTADADDVGASVRMGFEGGANATVTLKDDVQIMAYEVDIARDGNAIAKVEMHDRANITAKTGSFWLTRNTHSGAYDENFVPTKYSAELLMDGDTTINVLQADMHVGYYADTSTALLTMRDRAKITVGNGKGVWIGDVSGAKGDIKVYGNASWDVSGVFAVSSSDGYGRVYFYDNSALTADSISVGNYRGIGSAWFYNNSTLTANRLVVGSSDSTGLLELHDNVVANVKYFGAATPIYNKQGDGVIRLYDNAVINATEGWLEFGRDGKYGYLELNGRSKVNAPTNNLWLGRNAPQSWFKLNDTAEMTVNEMIVGHWGAGGGWIELLGDSTFTSNGTIEFGSDFSTAILDIRNTADYIARGPRFVASMSRQTVTGGTGGNASINLYDSGTFTAETGTVTLGSIGTATLKIHNDAVFTVAQNDLYVGGDGLGNNRDAREPRGVIEIDETATLAVPNGKIIVGAGVIAGREVILDNGNVLGDGNPSEFSQNGIGHAEITANGGVISTQGFSLGKEDGTASIKFNGAILNATAANPDFFAGLAKGDVTLGENGVIIDTDENDIGISSGLAGTGTLTKNGTGTLTISGDNSDWTGALNVTEGEVHITDGAKVTFVLDCADAAQSGTYDAVNVYAGGSAILIGNATLNVVLANTEELAQGTYTFNVLPSANAFGPVSVTGLGGAYSYAYNAGKITLTVGEASPESGFANWATEEFDSDELADPAISGPEADPQNIGVPNLLRYALGLGRNESPVGALPTLTKNDTAGGLGALSASDSYTFSFRYDAAKEDISYIVETSEDLKNWIPVSTPATVDEQNGTASVVISADGAVRKFFRLKIVQK